MKAADREAQIIRIESHSRYPLIHQALEATLRREATAVTQATIEAALVEEVQAHLQQCTDHRPGGSGYYQRTVNTQYGQISTLAVPKLRHDNGKRVWSILERYQRTLGS